MGSVQLNGVVVSFVVVLKFPNITIRTTKTVESIQLKGRIKIVGCFPPFYLPLTQAHCPVIWLLETFWTFTTLVVLRHLESIWTLTIVTSWTVDTPMAAVVFNILIVFFDICKRPNWNMTCHIDGQYFRPQLFKRWIALSSG